VQRAVAAIEGRWKLAILFRLFERPVLRFSELERDIEDVSQKMLAQHLRELEHDGLILRTVHPEVPPRSLSDLSLSRNYLKVIPI